jgi:uncharacterized protein YcbK (DUF882 family)
MARPIVSIASLLLTVCCGIAVVVLNAADDDLAPGDRLRIRALSYSYDTGSVFVMPHEKIPVAVTAPASRLFTLVAPRGKLVATGPNRWTWEAPGEAGRYPLEVKNPAGKKVFDFNAFVMIPATQVKDGYLNGFHIGSYPKTPLGGKPSYIPPQGFIEITKDNEDTKASPAFRLKEFLTKQKAGYPKYLVLDERLLYVLEAVGTELEARGWEADDIFVMSGYRTPYYNKLLDDTQWSMHQWGRAADIFLDKDKDGNMDDFNKDKVVDRRDAEALAALVDKLSKTAELADFIGGIGIYSATSAHPPFVHVDTRPWKARW